MWMHAATDAGAAAHGPQLNNVYVDCAPSHATQLFWANPVQSAHPFFLWLTLPDPPYHLEGMLDIGITAGLFVMFGLEFDLRVLAALPTLAQGPAAEQSSQDAHDASAEAADVTFTKDIAPILARSCVRCHNPVGVAPMSLTTYEETRPWARQIARRTAIRDRMGAMPPWYMEKDIGIQHFKDDMSLSDHEIAAIEEMLNDPVAAVRDRAVEALANLRRRAGR